MNTNGEDSPHWKGGRVINSQGYVLIYSLNHPYKDRQNYVREHRLVYEKYLTEMNGITTYIHRSITIDHIDKNKQNNNIENLRLFTHPQHTSIHNCGGEIISMDDRVCFLCDSKETYLRKKSGRPHWYRYKDNKIICHKCYNKNNKRIKK